jgi:hypothetical protein
MVMLLMAAVLRHRPTTASTPELDVLERAKTVLFVVVFA